MALRMLRIERIIKTMKNRNRENDVLRYFAYYRKSSEDNKERQAQSIESQRQEMRRLAREQNLNIVAEFEEERSAHTTGRPVFNEMMGRIFAGEANALLVWHANRLARNAVDGGFIVSYMDSGIIREVKTTGRTYFSESSDKFFILLEFAISKKDSDDKSDVVKRGLKTKCEKGSMPGLAPTGYLNTPNLPGGSRYIMKDDDRFEALRKIWNMMATGNYSVLQLINYLNNDLGFKTRQFKREGGNSLCLSRLYKIFRDPFFYGTFEYPRGSGKFYKGSHEPMITKETFDLVQKILDRGTVIRPKTKEFAYTGLIRCGNCKAQITAEDKIKNQKNGNIHNYTYYHCTGRKDPNCNEGSVRLENLETQILATMERIEVPAIFEKYAIKWLKVLYKQELETGDLLLSKNAHRRTLLDNEKDRLLSLYMSEENQDKSLLNAQEFSTNKKRIDGELSSLEYGIADLKAKLNSGILKTKRDFRFATFAVEWMKVGSLADKRALLSAVGQNLSLYENKLSITLNKPFQILSDNHEGIIEGTPRLELLIGGLNKEKTEDFSSVFPQMLRGLDSNQRPPGS